MAGVGRAGEKPAHARSGTRFGLFATTPQLATKPGKEDEDKSPGSQVSNARYGSRNPQGEVFAEIRHGKRDWLPERLIATGGDRDVENLRFDALHQMCLRSCNGFQFTLDLREFPAYLDQRVDILAGAVGQSLKLRPVVSQHGQLPGGVFDRVGQVLGGRRLVGDLGLPTQSYDELSYSLWPGSELERRIGGPTGTDAGFQDSAEVGRRFATGGQCNVVGRGDPVFRCTDLHAVLVGQMAARGVLRRGA